VHSSTSIARGGPWLFFVLACLISWIFWIPATLWLPEAYHTPVLLIGSFGPWAAAMLLLHREGGRPALAGWLRSNFRLRLNWLWYLAAALLIPLGMALLHHGIFLLAGGKSAFTWTSDMLLYPVAMLLTTLLGGGQEEPGWRSYATPALIKRFHPMLASTVVGLVWVIWHLPLYLMDDWGGGDQGLEWFFLYAIALSMIMTWLYFRSGRNIIPVMLLHGATNVIFRYFPREGHIFNADHDFDILKTVAYWVVALIIIAATRGRLGVVHQADDDDS